MSRFLFLLPFFAVAAHADPLKPADREALLEKLDKLSDEADAKVDARFKVAVTAFRAAAASDSATMDFYLKCVEKVEYEDAYKKSQDFREWKRKQSESLDKPGFRSAMRYQLNWLLLTLEAASSSTASTASLTRKIEGCMDSVFADLDKLKDGKDALGRSATNTVFAKAYNLEGVKVEKWPNSPIDLEGIFNGFILPPLRTSTRIPQLRAAWQKWIKYEGMVIEKWPKEQRGEDEKARVGMKDAMRSPDYDKFLAETYPEMLWLMEVDCYKAGDQQASATRMLAHIEKYVAHKKAQSWTRQFRNLINGKPDAGDKADIAPDEPAPEPAPLVDETTAKGPAVPETPPVAPEPAKP